jgi:hypothetical protein
MKNFFKSMLNYLLACVVTKTFWSIIFILCVLVILGGGFDNELKQLFIKRDVKHHHITEILRNITLTLAGLIGLPFLVWRSEIADRMQKTAQETQAISHKAHFNDRYIKAVEQLSDDKETIRLAGTHALIQLLDEAKSRDHYEKNQDVILNVLWCFMAENSREAIKVYNKYKSIKDDEIAQKLYDYVSDMQQYHSQFRMILEALPKKDNFYWWENRTMCNVFLLGFDLRSMNLNNSDLKYINISSSKQITDDAFFTINNLHWFSDCFDAKLNSAELRGSNLQGASFIWAEFKETVLIGADLRHTDLSGTNLNSACLRECKFEGAGLTNDQYNNQIVKFFPDGFKPKDHGMINLDEVSEMND